LAAEHAFGLGQADLVDRLVAAAGEGPLSTLDQARLEWLREIFNDGRPGDATRIKELCDVALVAERAGDRDLALNLLHGASLRAWWASAGRQAQDQIVDTALSLPDAAGHPRYVAVLAVAHPTWQGGTVLRALAELDGRRPADPAALFHYGMAAHAVGDPERVVDLFALADRRLREQGRLGMLSQVLTMQILDRMELGEWNQAMAAAEEARRLAADTGQPIWDTGSLSLNAIMLSLRGDNEIAQEMAERAAQAAGTRGLNNLLACVQLARGFGFMSEGRHSDAYEQLRRMFDPQDAAFHESERYHALAPLAEAARNAGREDDARLVVADMTAVAQMSPAPTLLVHLDYARAVLAADDDAEPLFQKAFSRNLIRWPWHRARLELAYGSWLRRQRRVTASRVPLRSAYTTLDLIGARAWAEQAAIELRAAGERTAGPQPAVLEMLSPQESQVARLAAEGLSNREIGEQLYLSPRSVGSILYRLFPKLNITSRGQLALKLGLRGDDERP
ncbi:MAG: LuxR family transcriptional regulator, partial [Catenulispora sp.]|nr:LuxR family transcriptional regulator [Catenulispora sp.]